MSFITALSGFFAAIPRNAGDVLLGLVTGIPSGGTSISDDFIDNIGLSQVKLYKNGCGYYKNLLIMIFENGSSVAEKHEVFKKYGLRLLGWACPSDMFIVSSGFTDYNELVSLGEEIEKEYPAVLMASPVPFVKSSPDTTPDDPFDSGYDWNDENKFGSGRWYIDAAHIREAWNYSEYFGKIKVGVLDSGFDTGHEDLKDRISFPSSGDKRRNVAAPHGTFVAGVIGAQSNNGKGIAGINPASELVCIDWKADEGQNWNETLHIFFGICRLVKSGAKVINMSLGTSGNTDPEDPESVRTMNTYAGIYSAVMSVLIGRGYDFVAVQSAGNGDINDEAADSFFNAHFATFREDNVISLWPGISKKDLLDRVLVVGAATYRYSDEKYHLASFSNFGDGVVIAAPGARIYGLTSDEEKYTLMSGTSCAAPIVAGIVSLVWGINPSLTGAQVRNIVVDNAGETVYPYKDKGRSCKLVDAVSAVEAALKTKYKMYSLTGEVDTGDYDTPADLVTIKSGEKSKDITAPSGKISLIYENGDGTIIINGEYGENEFPETGFSIDGKDLDLGKISFIPAQTQPLPAEKTGEDD